MTWFKWIFGFEEEVPSRSKPDEKTWPENRKHFEYDENNGLLTATVDPEKKDDARRTFQAGLFYTPSLKYLRDQTKDLLAQYDEEGKGQISVKQDYGDVSVFHVLPENRGAVFQAASQFNTLEHTSQRGTPGLGIECYSRDKTQGPCCAIACAPGTVVRNYMQEGATHNDCKVNTLDNVDSYLQDKKGTFFKVCNGYTLSNQSNLEKLNESLEDGTLDKEEIRLRLKIGVQEDTQVVCSRFGADIPRDLSAEQRVTQVYCSAISVSYSGLPERLWEPFARLILESLYEQTLHVALLNMHRHQRAAAPGACAEEADQGSAPLPGGADGLEASPAKEKKGGPPEKRPEATSIPPVEDPKGAHKVFLTAVGGGVFGNRMEWIGSAIDAALKKFKHVPLEVILVSYSSSTPEFKRLEDEYSGTDNSRKT
mmetsp:Transcript_11328/g.24974  ORF Transcript_11328/g.24974 Transcript_11328/m.24974 type:complete len:425 (-) Transcript_11328:45-1319(-)|eukprot:CAMPEP_0206458268 /NCGR_PEP_ID=MMETSP0324_2-20121206/23465_1 /ASSEMBLY_ACC=CAM_ASM_000836 /TAXON_ID=2866 /ORGANISM="Crypthecodinium cohnii, Strain Seligo" /LENGTH=424 /DNA_ID=CAMNT_0053929567 /DNA_START=153 /DNA_END=1427 /DNA_ORIENTATION=+